MGIVFGGTGVASGRPFNTLEMQAGSTYLIPSGTWRLDLGPYTSYQEFDQTTQIWRSPGQADGRTKYVDSDGVNFRIANQTGCVVGATVTSGGSGYTSAPSVTVNSGGATFQAILGPYVTSITVGNGGTGYTYPPLVFIQNPPQPGVSATAYATIAAGVVTSVTITDNGANYSGGAPIVNLVNDPRDTTGNGAAATANLAGSGAVVAVLATNHGTPSGISTTGTLPTLTISGGGGSAAAAVPIMAWSITGINAATTSGSGYPTNVLVTAGAVASGTPQYTNPTVQSGLLHGMQAFVAVTTSGGALTTGSTVYNGGIYAQNPTAYVLAGVAGTSAATGAVNFTVGGQNDVALLYPV